MDFSYRQQSILIAGTEKVALSICVCLLKAGHRVTLLNPSATEALITIDKHITDIQQHTGEIVNSQHLNVIRTLDKAAGYDIAIAITNENLDEKAAIIQLLENYLDADVLIAINTESIALSTLQEYAKIPGRLIGANWTEPAHTTYFLEIITNQATSHQLADNFYQTAKILWHKDPYVLRSDKGIRARMMCAILREAFYLLENDYVSVEDIDRSLRNDGGYYLPFAGNFRYMDLMGTYMYGVVMKDLNPELSKNTHIPKFCQDLIDNGSKGMVSGKGFYNYEPGEAEQWEKVFSEFSYRIEEIISKYPFNYIEEDATVVPNHLL